MPTHTIGIKLGRVDIMKAALYEVGLPELAEQVHSCRESDIYPYYCAKPHCTHDVPLLETNLWTHDNDLSKTVIKCFWLGHISMGCDCRIEPTGEAIYCRTCFAEKYEEDGW